MRVEGKDDARTDVFVDGRMVIMRGYFAAVFIIALASGACGGSGSTGGSGDGGGVDAATGDAATGDATSPADAGLDEQAPGPEAAVDGGTTEASADTGAEDGTAGDAIAVDAAARDAPAGDAPAEGLDATTGADASTESGGPDSGSCNSLTVTALVSFGCVPFQTPPTATGGSIAAGTYVLTSGTLYDPSGACTGIPVPTAETLDFLAGGVMQVAENASGWIAPENRSYTFSAGGNQLATDETCPSPGQTQLLQYTATPTTLTTSFDGLVLVYSRM